MNVIEEMEKYKALHDLSKDFGDKIGLSVLRGIQCTSFKAFINNIHDVMIQLAEDVSTGVKIYHWNQKLEKKSLDYQLKIKQGLIWMRKQTTKLAQTDCYHQKPAIRKMVRKLYRHLTLTKEALRDDVTDELIKDKQTGNLIVVNRIEYSSVGHYQHCWVMFNEVCRAMALKREFRTLETFSKCKPVTEVVYDYEDCGSNDHISYKCNSPYAKSIQLQPYNSAPFKRYRCLSGEIETFNLDSKWTEGMWISKSEVNELMEVEPEQSFYSLALLSAQSEEYRNGGGVPDTNSVEVQARNIWRGVMLHHGSENLISAEFDEFKKNTLSRLGLLLTFLQAEKMEISDLNYNSKTGLFSQQALNIAHKKIKEVFHEFEGQEVIELPNKVAIEKAKQLLSTHGIPKEVLGVLEKENVWRKAVESVCKEEKFEAKRGCKKGTKSRKITSSSL